MRIPIPVVLRLTVAACLAATGYLHADLYLSAGYRSIPLVGPSFLLLASGCFAVAVLLIVADPIILRLGAAGLAVGALAGFIASRTVGIGSFIEHGLDPAPQALLALLAETGILVLLGISELLRRRSADRRCSADGS